MIPEFVMSISKAATEDVPFGGIALKFEYSKEV